MSILMFYVVIFSPAQPLHIGGNVMKCLLQAVRKVKMGGESGRAWYSAPVVFE